MDYFRQLSLCATQRPAYPWARAKMALMLWLRPHLCDHSVDVLDALIVSPRLFSSYSTGIQRVLRSTSMSAYFGIDSAFLTGGPSSASPVRSMTSGGVRFVVSGNVCPEKPTPCPGAGAGAGAKMFCVACTGCLTAGCDLPSPVFAFWILALSPMASPIVQLLAMLPHWPATAHFGAIRRGFPPSSTRALLLCCPGCRL